MLAMLIRETFGSLAPAQVDAESATYQRLLGDPLRHLQRLLGHAHVATTYVYLDNLSDANEVVEAALDRWMAQLDGSGDGG